MTPASHPHASNAKSSPKRSGVSALIALAVVAFGLVVPSTSQEPTGRYGPVVIDHGDAVHDAFAFDSTSSPSTGFRLTTASVTEPTTTKLLAVLLANFTADQREPWTKEQVRDVLFGANSASAFWSEVSNGQLALQGDVFGYFTLDTSNATCSYSAWMTAARAAAAEASVPLVDFTNVMLVFPKQQACTWSGVANIDGPNSWINGAVSVRATSHELGHNFGVHHANSLSCAGPSGSRVAFSTSCSSSEYGDPYDVMGVGAWHTSNWHRRQMGFLSDVDQLTVTSSGAYTVAPAAVDGASPRILRIARPAGDFFYLELRQRYGAYDAFDPMSPAVNGVLIRLAPDGGAVQSQLIDTTPETTSFADSPLVVGRTFADPVADISISTVSISSAGATVNVQFEASSSATSTPTPLPTPTPTLSPTASPAPVAPDVTRPTTPSSLVAVKSGTKASLSWRASTDDRGYVTYRVYRGTTVVSRPTSTTATILLKVGKNVFSVRAVDRAGNLSARSNTVTVYRPR